MKYVKHFNKYINSYVNKIYIFYTKSDILLNFII